eukprot:gnl/Spiro4/10412_TR5565_c0_g1_i1.p1 gnl/Spiro4/10412_TR5565_c0_g1~~gnl/Spiro4/10412_TR5565_c0_g1_i1.p1  ORF type:complete len:420 (+),score=94.86 gnl/Spiro4/10412_TR5565_c0_g1_i1:30-1262(+)
MMNVHHRTHSHTDRSAGSDGGLAQRVVEQVKRLDVYAKPKKGFRVQTSSGAIISIIGGAIMFFLFISELRLYTNPEVVDRFSVDLSRREKMLININVTFPRIPCAMLQLDAIDAAGEQQIGVVLHMSKRRLNSDGVLIEEKDEETGSPGGLPQDYLKPGYCGSCYGAEEKPGDCCNTCDDVRRAFAGRESLRNAEHTEQCVRDAFLKKLLSKAGANEGCELSGSLHVNKVSGNFHFAPGKSYEQDQMHIHEFIALDTLHFNVSHKFNHLSFGKPYPNMVNPLDGVQRDVAEGAAIINYYVKVIPTEYESESAQDEPLKTNQYSVTMHQRPISADVGALLPGVFVVYDLSPIKVLISRRRKSLGHFLTNVCAIVGGVFTIAGILDSLIYNASKSSHRRRSAAPGFHNALAP